MSRIPANEARSVQQTQPRSIRVIRGQIKPSTPGTFDSFIDPVEVAGSALLLPRDAAAPTYYLQTSPEFVMKRLIAMGCGSIYSIVSVFRAGERSDRHNIEFTMLQWYDVIASMQAVIEQTISLVTHVLAIPRPQVITCRQLFRQSLGFDPIDEPLEALHDALHDAVASVDTHLAASLRSQRDEMLDVLMTAVIEPMVREQSLVIQNYSLTQAAFARQSEDDPQTAERFEWMIHGLEIANVIPFPIELA